MINSADDYNDADKDLNGDDDCNDNDDDDDDDDDGDDDCNDNDDADGKIVEGWPVHFPAGCIYLTLTSFSVSLSSFIK